MVIVIEGPPCSGKTTLISHINKILDIHDLNFIPEFGSDLLGQIINDNISKSGKIIENSIIETYILFSNLLEKQKQIDIKKINIIDTFLDSIKAHQISKIGNEKYFKIEDIFKPYLLKPDFVFFIKNTPEILSIRMKQRGNLLNENDMKIFLDVVDYYKNLDCLSFDDIISNIKLIINK